MKTSGTSHGFLNSRVPSELPTSHKKYDENLRGPYEKVLLPLDPKKTF
jgi:hypothetical protein